MVLDSKILRTVVLLAVALLGTNTSTQASAQGLLERVQAGEQTQVVTMGTSLTASSQWAGMLEAWLQSQSPTAGSVNLTNRGVSGSASDHPTTGLSGLDRQMPLALADAPDAVFIEFAINDAVDDPARGYELSLSESRSNLISMIDQFEAQNPDVFVILQTMNNVSINGEALRPLLPEFYDVVRDVADERGLLLIDHHAGWVDLHQDQASTWASYIPDGLHPNTAGHEAITLPGITGALESQVPTPSTAVFVLGGALLSIGRRGPRRYS